MPKKKVEAAEEVVERVAPGIAPLTTDFGREDLNGLRDKLNEVINSL